MKEQRWLVSGYSAEGEPDVKLLCYNPQSGKVVTEAHTAIGQNPSYLISDGSRVFAALEVHEPDVAATIVELSVGNGKIETGKRISVEGAYGLCHLSQHAGHIYGACWASGHLFCVDDALKEVKWCVRNDDGSNKTPHAHWSVTGPDNRLYCADVGLDCLLIYKPQDGKLVRVVPMREGTAPRQILFDPCSGRIYVVNESDPSFLEMDPNLLSVLHTWKLPKNNYPGAACLTVSGLLLIPNRGPDSISLFDTSGSGMKKLGETPLNGQFPRSLAVSSDASTVLSMNQRSNNVQFFALEEGKLIAKAQTELSGASSAIEIK